MAKFIYKMQNVLNVKLRLETQAKTEYAEKMRKLQDEEDRMRQLVSQSQHYQDEVKTLTSERLDIPKIKQCNDSIKVMKDLMNEQAIKIRVAQKNLEIARGKLSTAMQERKIHEKLREEAFEEFKLELNAEEKKEIDEVVSFNYNNRETGE